MRYCPLTSMTKGRKNQFITNLTLRLEMTFIISFTVAHLTTGRGHFDMFLKVLKLSNVDPSCVFFSLRPCHTCVLFSVTDVLLP